MSSNPTLDRLIDCFASLPGVGRKSAARLAYHVLDMSDEEAFDLPKLSANLRQSCTSVPYAITILIPTTAEFAEISRVITASYVLWKVRATSQR